MVTLCDILFTFINNRTVIRFDWLVLRSWCAYTIFFVLQYWRWICSITRRRSNIPTLSNSPQVWEEPSCPCSYRPPHTWEACQVGWASPTVKWSLRHSYLKLLNIICKVLLPPKSLCSVISYLSSLAILMCVMHVVFFTF